MNDDLRDRLDELERAAGFGPGAGGRTVVTIAGDLPDSMMVPARDPGDALTVTIGGDPETVRAEQVAVPTLLPPGYRDGVTVLDAEDVKRLWREMPADAREQEREIRRERGDPIPPILESDDDTDR